MISEHDKNSEMRDHRISRWRLRNISFRNRKDKHDRNKIGQLITYLQSFDRSIDRPLCREYLETDLFKYKCKYPRATHVFAKHRNVQSNNHVFRSTINRRTLICRESERKWCFSKTIHGCESNTAGRVPADLSTPSCSASYRGRKRKD